MNFSRLDHPPLAFVDVETTGVDPRENRITEIGVVTADGGGAREWTTVINPLTRRREDTLSPEGITDEMRLAAPRFKDIAVELAAQLAGRLLVAHNARFDYSFLKAEFSRAGIDFHADVICSLMLSRKLYAQFAHHDVDSLIEHHALEAGVRHRAMHDARLVWQFWRTIHRELPESAIASAIGVLRAGPLLPAHLHPSLIDRLPDAPGIFEFHGEADEVLMTGTALNLRLRILNYFRLDRMSGRALSISHRIRNVTWRVTQGLLGAKLRLALLTGESLRAREPRCETVYSWRFAPDESPCLSLVSLSDLPRFPADELFGLFESPRKACNALNRTAAARKLCHSLLGIGNGRGSTCPGCPVEQDAAACDRGPGRLVHLTRAFTALRELRVPAWPYDGPIGIRERSELHIIDGWRYLGTARNDAEIHAVLETRAGAFYARVFRVLAKTLRKLPPSRIVLLPARPLDVAADCDRPESGRNDETGTAFSFDRQGDRLRTRRRGAFDRNVHGST